MPIYAAAEKFDFSLLEAARDLGAKSFFAFRKIFLPGVRRGVISAVLMVFIPAIGSYVIPDLVGGSDSELIGNKIYQRTFPDRNLPHASALATITGIAVLVPLACVAWWVKRQDEREAKRIAEALSRKIIGGES
jgi:spermidine/putrescine transport system permease protein